MCEKIGDKIKMGPRLLLDGAEPQPDHDQWTQCPQCQWLCPIWSEKEQQFMTAFADLTDNPFDDQKGQVVSAKPRRDTKEGKAAMARKQRERLRPKHKDAEIQAELDRHGEDNVKIVFDSDP